MTGPHPTGSEFAAEIAGRTKASHFAAIYEGDPPSRIVAESDHFVAFVDLAPLVAGHLLVVPRVDVPAFAALSSTAWQDWEDFRETLFTALAAHWTNPVSLEHGSTESMQGGACISHAHLHLLPAEIDVVSEIRADGIQLSEINDQRDIPARPGEERPYLYAGAADGSAGFAWVDQIQIPRQYVRKLAARALGLGDPDWDWEAVVDRALLRSTVTQLKSKPTRGD